MNVVSLSWYISAMSALLLVMVSAISYAPGSEIVGIVMVCVFGCGALGGLLLALWLRRFPRDHRVHQWRPLRVVLIVVAGAVTVLAILIG